MLQEGSQYLKTGTSVLRKPLVALYTILCLATYIKPGVRDCRDVRPSGAHTSPAFPALVSKGSIIQGCGQLGTAPRLCPSGTLETHESDVARTGAVCTTRASWENKCGSQCAPLSSWNRSVYFM